MRGGTIVATGTPEELAAHPTSYTGEYLSRVPGIVPVSAEKEERELVLSAPARKPRAKKGAA